MNGSRCAHIWQPDDWATRSADAKVTVALNVCADHVSAYHPDVGCHAPKNPDKQQWAEHLLVSAKGDQDAHLYDDMVQFDWQLLLGAVRDKRKAVFWTDEPLERLEAARQRPGV